jgi:hypothetical protein
MGLALIFVGWSSAPPVQRNSVARWSLDIYRRDLSANLAQTCSAFGAKT